MRLFFALIVVGLSLAAPATGAEPTERRKLWDWPEDQRARSDFSRGELAHLAKYIGTRNFEAIFDDPLVKAKLERMMGPAVADLFERMETRGSVEYREGCYCFVLYGTQHNIGDKENMTVVLKVWGGEVFVGLTIGGRKKVYVPWGPSDDRRRYLPDPIYEWFFWNEIQDVIIRRDRSKFDATLIGPRDREGPGGPGSR